MMSKVTQAILTFTVLSCVLGAALEPAIAQNANQPQRIEQGLRDMLMKSTAAQNGVDGSVVSEAAASGNPTAAQTRRTFCSVVLKSGLVAKVFQAVCRLSCC